MALWRAEQTDTLLLPFYFSFFVVDVVVVVSGRKQRAQDLVTTEHSCYKQRGKREREIASLSRGPRRPLAAAARGRRSRDHTKVMLLLPGRQRVFA